MLGTIPDPPSAFHGSGATTAGVLSPGAQDVASGRSEAHVQYDKNKDVVPLGQDGHDAAEWEATIQSVVGAVLSIRISRPCSFDSASSDCSQATGFVVDAQRG